MEDYTNYTISLFFKELAKELNEDCYSQNMHYANFNNSFNWENVNFYRIMENNIFCDNVFWFEGEGCKATLNNVGLCGNCCEILLKRQENFRNLLINLQNFKNINEINIRLTNIEKKLEELFQSFTRIK
jgi:hypothetical protein